MENDKYIFSLFCMGKLIYSDHKNVVFSVFFLTNNLLLSLLVKEFMNAAIPVKKPSYRHKFT